MSDKIRMGLYASIDHIITLPAFNWDNTKADVPMVELYGALKQRYSTSPTKYAADGLGRVVSKGDVVILTTGFYQVDSGTYESDGPIGAAVLARALEVAYGARPVVLVGEGYAESMRPICTASGLKVSSIGAMKREDHSVVVEDFPLRDGSARAESLLKELAPSAIIAVETPDRNSRGAYHRAKGFNVTDVQAKFPDLFSAARDERILTVGIGDFGNEIGMATLNEALLRLIPSHATCRCDCGGGIVGSTETDVSIIANISNWGAYGVEAAIALQTENPQAMHDKLLESMLLEECVRVGYVDGATGYVDTTVDGAPRHVNLEIVDLLRSVVDLACTKSFAEYVGLRS